MRLLTLGAFGLVAAASMTALLAQTVDGIDVQAIKTKSADLQAAAQAFVDQIKDRGDAFRDAAVTVREAGMENMQRGAYSPAERRDGKECGSTGRSRGAP